MSYGVATVRVTTCLLELRFVCGSQEVRTLSLSWISPNTDWGRKGWSFLLLFHRVHRAFSPLLCCDQTLQLSCSSSQGEAKGLLWGHFRTWFCCRFERESSGHPERPSGFEWERSWCFMGKNYIETLSLSFPSVSVSACTECLTLVRILWFLPSTTTNIYQLLYISKYLLVLIA